MLLECLPGFWQAAGPNKLTLVWVFLNPTPPCCTVLVCSAGTSSVCLQCCWSVCLVSGRLLVPTSSHCHPTYPQQQQHSCRQPWQVREVNVCHAPSHFSIALCGVLNDVQQSLSGQPMMLMIMALCSDASLSLWSHLGVQVLAPFVMSI